MVRLEEQLLHERNRRQNLETEVEALKKLSQDLVSKMTTVATSVSLSAKAASFSQTPMAS
jgi:hypothetical protein